MVNVFFYLFFGIIKSLLAPETYLIYSESADPVISRPYDPINGRIGLSKPLLILPNFSICTSNCIYFYLNNSFFSNKEFYVYISYLSLEQNQIYWQYYFLIKKIIIVSVTVFDIIEDNYNTIIDLNENSENYLYTSNISPTFDLYTNFNIILIEEKWNKSLKNVGI